MRCGINLKIDLVHAYWSCPRVGRTNARILLNPTPMPTEHLFVCLVSVGGQTSVCFWSVGVGLVFGWCLVSS